MIAARLPRIGTEAAWKDAARRLRVGRSGAGGGGLGARGGGGGAVRGAAARRAGAGLCGAAGVSGSGARPGAGAERARHGACLRAVLPERGGEGPAVEPRRCGGGGGRADRARGAPRHPQDARLRAVPRGRRGGRAAELCCLVRARAPDRGGQRGVLPAPVRRHGLADRDARGDGGLPGRGAGAERRGEPAARGGGCARGAVADLFREHLQPGAVEGEGDDGGDAEEVLEEPAGGGADPGADRRGGAAGGGDARGGADDAAAAGRADRRERVAEMAKTEDVPEGLPALGQEIDGMPALSALARCDPGGAGRGAAAGAA